MLAYSPFLIKRITELTEQDRIQWGRGSSTAYDAIFYAVHKDWLLRLKDHVLVMENIDGSEASFDVGPSPAFRDWTLLHQAASAQITEREKTEAAKIADRFLRETNLR